MKKIVRKIVIGIVIASIVICFGFIVIGVICFFGDYERINKQQTITGIIIPMICAIIGACIPIALDNSLSNEKLKISLNRLEWWWKYHCIDENGKPIDGYKSHGFDEEYKLISKNRGESHDKILREMIGKDYREAKYSVEAESENITKEKFLMDWIKDHFIY